MTTNPFKPGDKVKLAGLHDSRRRYDSVYYILCSPGNPEILTVESVKESFVKLYEIEGKYLYTRFQLVSRVDKPIGKTFEVGKRYKTISGIIGTCLFVGKYLSFFSYTKNSGEQSEFSVSNNYVSFYEEVPEEISCEKILLVLKPKEGDQYSHLFCRQVVHNGFQNALNGFLDHGIKYNLEAAFESNYKNGKIEMIDITEKFKEACGISS